MMSRKKKFCLSSSSAPENAVESSSSLWGDIVQKSILAFAHTFNCFTRASLVGWLRDLVEEVQAAAQAVDVRDKWATTFSNSIMPIGVDTILTVNHLFRQRLQLIKKGGVRNCATV